MISTSSKTANGNGSRVAGRGKVLHFTNLDAWKVAHHLTLKIYEWTSTFPDEERFGLTSQMRRSAVSIESNIAEGFGRFGPADKRNFYTIARASCFEVESQIITSRDLGHLSEENAKEGQRLCEKSRQTLNGLIRMRLQQPSHPVTRYPLPDLQS